MIRTINKFILSAITITQFLSADIGHNSVVYEGRAGDIPLRVFVQLPGVVPGLADISVRVFADGVNKVTVRPQKQYRDTKSKAPPADIAEPVQGAGGVIPPSKNYFDLIQPVLKKYEIPMIADEVICGLGRTGNLWGCDTYNIKPDIIISSKCLTAGYFPMGAVIVNKEFADKHDIYFYPIYHENYRLFFVISLLLLFPFFISLQS